MDLLEKVEQFEKMALDLLSELESDTNNNQDAETIEEYTAQHLQNRLASVQRIKKLLSASGK